MRLLLLEDSPGEAELFCEALALAWEKRGPDSAAPRPGTDVRRTAKDALECSGTYPDRKATHFLISSCSILISPEARA